MGSKPPLKTLSARLGKPLGFRKKSRIDDALGQNERATGPNSFRDRFERCLSHDRNNKHLRPRPEWLPRGPCPRHQSGQGNAAKYVPDTPESGHHRHPAQSAEEPEDQDQSKAGILDTGFNHHRAAVKG